MTSNGRQWVEHVGAAGLPDGFDKIPVGGQGIELAKPGFQSGTAWWKHESGKVLRCDPCPLSPAGAAALAKRQQGAAGDSTIGDTVGLAIIVSDTYAESALSNPGGAVGSAWLSQSPPSDVLNLVTPNDDRSGITDDVYVQYDSPPNAQIWKFGTQTQYLQASPNQVNQGKLTAIVPGGPTPGSPNTPSNTVQVQTGFQKALPWLLLAGGVVLVGAVGYAVVEKDKGKGRHERRENPARGRDKRRDRHGRFK